MQSLFNFDLLGLSEIPLEQYFVRHLKPLTKTITVKHFLLVQRVMASNLLDILSHFLDILSDQTDFSLAYSVGLDA